jgi:hypothetical protein
MFCVFLRTAPKWNVVCLRTTPHVTWISIAASLCMGMGAALLFLYAVKKDWFRDVEDAKYQVFWSDLADLVNKQERANGSQTKNEGRGR